MGKSYAILVVALVAVSTVNAQYNVNPCFGRPDGFARDLNSCAHYWSCNSGQATRGACQSNRLFDGETEQCVVRDQARCFQCPQNEPFRLLSVPRACPQYLLCFLGSVSLNACPAGLVFDGRTGIRNCNFEPQPGRCFRESDQGDGDGGPEFPRCPQITNRPLFIADRRSCSVFYVCTRTNEIPQRRECPSNLHINLRLGVCDHPQNANCQIGNPPTTHWPTTHWPTTHWPTTQWTTRPPTGPPTWPTTHWPTTHWPTTHWPTTHWPPTTRPPQQGVPAFRCPAGSGTLIPDRFDCNMYHQCLNGGRTRALRCQIDFFFDMISRRCLLPRDAQCYAHVYPSSDTNDTLIANKSESKNDLSSAEETPIEIRPVNEVNEK